MLTVRLSDVGSQAEILLDGNPVTNVTAVNASQETNDFLKVELVFRVPGEVYLTTEGWTSALTCPGCKGVYKHKCRGPKP